MHGIKKWRHLAVAATLVTFVACADEAAPTSPERTPAAAFDVQEGLQQLPSPRPGGRTVGPAPVLSVPNAPFPTYDAVMALVADQEPAFAGVYAEPDGGLTILLTDTSELPDARAALLTVTGDDQYTSVSRVRKAKYAYNELFAWKRALIDVFTVEGAVSLDIDERRNRIVIGVESGNDIGPVRQRASELGVPQAVVLTKFEEVPMFAVDLNDSFEPIPGGVRGGSSKGPGVGTCTWGFNVELTSIPGQFRHERALHGSVGRYGRYSVRSERVAGTTRGRGVLGGDVLRPRGQRRLPRVVRSTLQVDRDRSGHLR